MYRYIILIPLLFSALALNAQKTVTHQDLYWLRYYNLVNINKQFTWQNEIENRRFFVPNAQHQLIVHTRMHYRTGSQTNAGFGFTYSRQSSNFPTSGSTLVIPEYRGVQEFNYSIPLLDRLSLHQRIRLDERFIRRNQGDELISGYDFTLRVRLRLQANYIIQRESTSRRTILKVSNEVMLNAAGSNILYNYFDQNRIYIGIERDISAAFSAEIGYLQWYQQRREGNIFNRDIVRFTLYHKLKLHKTQ